MTRWTRNKDVNALLREAEKRGARIKRGTHIRVYPPDPNNPPITVASTCGIDKRNQTKRVHDDLAKAGLADPREIKR